MTETWLRTIGVSQPTVSRLIRKLESEGVIREYTMIPDFSKLGYQILGLTFVKLKETLNPGDVEKVWEITKQGIMESRFGLVMLERGLGMEYDGVIASLYRDYSDYPEHRSIVREYPFLEVSDTESFLINLDDPVHYLPFILKKYACLLLKMGQEKEEEKDQAAWTKNEKQKA
ncbi:hypothetical protein MUO74_05415 [Candidatus Bathyarchaeota archaeon]|nr:hypothetical protein [Candidatus Bathyarchaeota archaeon]